MAPRLHRQPPRLSIPRQAIIEVPGGLKNGVKIVMDEMPFMLLQHQSKKQGKGVAITKVKVKNMLTGAIVEKTCLSGKELQRSLKSEVFGRGSTLGPSLRRSTPSGRWAPSPTRMTSTAPSMSWIWRPMRCDDEMFSCHLKQVLPVFACICHGLRRFRSLVVRIRLCKPTRWVKWRTGSPRLVKRVRRIMFDRGSRWNGSFGTAKS